MRITNFEIKNFKGIQLANLEISTVAPGNVITLIGLNESGKTTALEALSHFVSVDTETSSIVNTVAPKQRPADLIPKSRKSNFTGNIEIKASLRLEDDDVSGLADFMKKEVGVRLDENECQRDISVTRVYSFKDSDSQTPTNMWHFQFSFYKKNGKC